MTAHEVIPQRAGVADHAAPDDGRRVDPAAVAQYSATALPAVLYLIGTYLYDGGTVPGPLQGVIGLAVTGLCTVLVRRLRRG